MAAIDSSAINFNQRHDGVARSNSRASTLKSSEFEGQIPPNPGHWSKYNIFYALIITTTLSCLLLVSTVRCWTPLAHIYPFVKKGRATVQILIQIFSSILGLIHVLTITRLINYATRIRFGRKATFLELLRTWADMSLPRMEWTLPFVPLFQ